MSREGPVDRPTLKRLKRKLAKWTERYHAAHQLMPSYQTAISARRFVVTTEEGARMNFEPSSSTRVLIWLEPGDELNYGDYLAQKAGFMQVTSATNLVRTVLAPRTFFRGLP